MQDTATSDNHIDEAPLRHGEGQVSEQSADSPLRRLAHALLDHGVEQASVQAAGSRTAEVLRVSSNGQSVTVWESGPSFLTGCWQVVGSTPYPESAADRIAARLAGDGR